MLVDLGILTTRNSGGGAKWEKNKIRQRSQQSLVRSSLSTQDFLNRYWRLNWFSRLEDYWVRTSTVMGIEEAEARLWKGEIADLGAGEDKGRHGEGLVWVALASQPV
ncbi:hypothetical protein U1Q18_032311 [Sarracenia purpurea var. burkii]